ncbi:MAG: hypothetical protein HYT43_01045 [Candidatus Taylorbacteria bacterium]|nr:hypothetical protein [Candidatus Taylorbacteria bacterium]
MGRKSKNKDNEWPSLLGGLKEETVGSILSFFFFFCFLFFVLSALGFAGMVGELSYKLLSRLFGSGYFLLPVISLFLGGAFLSKMERTLKTKILGAALFVSAGVGFIGTLWKGQGGLIGKAISSPLVALFDIYVPVALLGAAFLVSILITFDTSLSLPTFSFSRKKRDKETETRREAEPTADELYQREIDITPAAGRETEREPADKDKISSKTTAATRKKFIPPPLDLLEVDRGKPGVGDIKTNSNIIKRTLQNFGISVEMDEITIGPSVTRYALKPAEGVKLSRIVALQNDLSLSLAAHPIRIEAPIPGKSLVGIEIPNSTKTLVGLGTLLSAPEYRESEASLLIALGKGVAGNIHFANLGKMPHLLIAGATGSGKSVAIHGIITSLLYRNAAENLKFIMIDPKRVELTLYNRIPHLLTPVVTDPKKAILALKWAAREMERRYDILENDSVRDIQSYHRNVLSPLLAAGRDERGVERMSYIVIIIDELADIMSTYPRELEAAVVRLAQMSRAVGIHLILSTQRPSVNVITGLIKANIPTRLALQVASQVDSRTILDTAGAEKLLGAGDLLYLSAEAGKPVRIQSPFISESEVKRVVKYFAENYAEETPPEINFAEGSTFFPEESAGEDAGDDELYEEARQTVIQAGKASTSYLQRKLRIGYARAARIMDMLEERGIIGPGEGGAKARAVIVGKTGEIFGADGERRVI